MTRRKTASAPVTGYANLQRLCECIDAQIDELVRRQKEASDDKDIFAKLHDLTRSAALVQAELRKTGEDAERAFENLSLEKRWELVMGLALKFPPDMRRAFVLGIEEKGDALQ